MMGKEMVLQNKVGVKNCKIGCCEVNICSDEDQRVSVGKAKVENGAEMHKAVMEQRRKKAKP